MLPRMSFEILGMQYDPSRKLAPLKTTITPKEGDANKIIKQFMPVPYNVNFELAIYVKNQDDGLQIIEQILPFFQPSFSITIKMIKETDEKRDIPIVLNSIDYRDEYEGNFDKRQVIIWTLQFTAKTYLFGPTADSGVIRTAITNFYSDTATTTARREVTYTVKPKATTDQDGDGDVDAVGTRGNSEPYDGVIWLEQLRSTEPGPVFLQARPIDSQQLGAPESGISQYLQHVHMIGCHHAPLANTANLRLVSQCTFAGLVLIPGQIRDI